MSSDLLPGSSVWSGDPFWSGEDEKVEISRFVANYVQCTFMHSLHDWFEENEKKTTIMK